MTDSASDLRCDIIDQHGVPILLIPYFLNGEERYSDMGRGQEDRKLFEAMRAGALPTTSQVPYPIYMELFEPALKEGKDVLFLSFSSTLSHTIENARTAAQELKELYPERRVEVFDSRDISAGLGQMVLRALDNQQQGMSLDENLAWLQANWASSNVWFAVDDLAHLRRGGRISAATALVGKILDVKPILTVDETGFVAMREKVQGRKKALRTLLSILEKRITEPEKQTVVVIHGDCPEDALRLQEMVRIRIPVKDVQVWPVGPIVGTHAGPNVIALSFWGTPRA